MSLLLYYCCEFPLRGASWTVNRHATCDVTTGYLQWQDVVTSLGASGCRSWNPTIYFSLHTSRPDVCNKVHRHQSASDVSVISTVTLRALNTSLPLTRMPVKQAPREGFNMALQGVGKNKTATISETIDRHCTDEPRFPWRHTVVVPQKELYWSGTTWWPKREWSSGSTPCAPARTKNTTDPQALTGLPGNHVTCSSLQGPAFVQGRLPLQRRHSWSTF
jgi:hypothetical protein